MQLFDPQSANAKVIVLFTDGKTTAGPPPAPVAAAARAEGIILYCIGLIGSDGIDVSVLNDWATDPDASHVAVTPDAADLEDLFEFLCIRDEETETLLDEGFDYVVDAIDTLSPKAGLIRSCLERDIPVVSSMGAGAKTDPTRVRIEDIARSHHCPLAHMLRKRLHKMGIRTGFYVVFSDEPVREGSMMLCEETNKKSNVGTISYMPAVFGCHCASVVIRGLIGEMPPAAFAAETRDNVRHG